jgi:NAD(P)H-dependent flavin oxidoreductase YrpB (nitropropane dioxygenase family)
MFKTKITEMLKIKYPIIGGTMMYITTPELVASISEAGGLGILASAMYTTKEQLACAINRVRELTDKPFAVNINLFPMKRPVDNKEYVKVLADQKVKIIETSGHSAPVELSKGFKDAGMIWMHKCVGVRYALKVQEVGADIVTVVGYENGGATGRLDIGTLVLVPSVVDALQIPVIGGGGISDGRGFLAVLSLGAEGVIIGTRLMATKECLIHENLKQALLNATEMDTMLVMRSINATHRVWSNPAAQKCADLETKGATMAEILGVVSGENAQQMYNSGDINKGIVSCGQGVGLIHNIPTIKELFIQIIAQATEVTSRLAKS